jgi:Flp pilus assembly protein TadG
MRYSGPWSDMHRHGREDRGSLTAFVALFLVALMALLGLVVDGGREMSADQAAQAEAEQAARAGAGALSVQGLRSGQIQVDQQQAISDAVGFTVTSGHPGSVSVEGGVVTVTVIYSMPTSVLGIIGVSSLRVSATASAVDIAGVTREDQ